MSSMQPYYTFTKEPKDKQKLLAIELSGAQTAILVDHYCTNPACDCNDVLMELCEFTPDQKLEKTSAKKHLKRLASFLVNTQDWTIRDLEVYEENRPIEPYIEDFSESLTEDLRLMLRSRLQEAKAYGGDDASRQPELEYQPGQCVGFVEVYPEHAPDKFQFEHIGTEYLVDDQYCIDPACKCHEAILTYIPLTDENVGSEHQFTLILSLTTGKYTVESASGYGAADIQEIHNAYLQHIRRNLGLFRGRYAKMKEYGRTRISSASSSDRRNVPIVRSAKVGRNDPCPCGSGKKFKKCCGMSTGT